MFLHSLYARLVRIPKKSRTTSGNGSKSCLQCVYANPRTCEHCAYVSDFIKSVTPHPGLRKQLVSLYRECQMDFRLYVQNSCMEYKTSTKLMQNSCMEYKTHAWSTVFGIRQSSLSLVRSPLKILSRRLHKVSL